MQRRPKQRSFVPCKPCHAPGLLRNRRKMAGSHTLAVHSPGSNVAPDESRSNLSRHQRELQEARHIRQKMLGSAPASA
ncbi:hypothetical protein MESS2_400021 [Mesorhizobium metallidurans STM 2683]|uniref:Uncharacterized protein n=1 Tax=Mesorhizobium metallidurans STM 2683 TaxID=1297569 RepID=M5ERB0_9HYPH|nr:hypothetical protein MESS2_400021 [Mesorhizobium metallidurans STM 2683]